MNTKLLTPKARQHLSEIVYALEPHNGRHTTYFDAINYALETLADLEDIVDDPVTFITEVKDGTRTVEKYLSPWKSPKSIDDLDNLPLEDPSPHPSMTEARPSKPVLIDMGVQGLHIGMYLHAHKGWQMNGYRGPWAVIKWMYIPV